MIKFNGVTSYICVGISVRLSININMLECGVATYFVSRAWNDSQKFVVLHKSSVSAAHTDRGM